MSDDVITFLENSGFDDFTKIRYIYRYVCNNFSYDTRFYYGSESLKDKIYNKRVNINNVEDFEIACYSFAHVLVDLLSLFNIYSEIKFDSGMGYRHSYVIVKHMGIVLKLDPTKKHDITRVKMHSSTLDFNTLIDDPIFVDQLADADKAIDEKIDNDVDLLVYYNNETLLTLFDFVNYDAKSRGIDEDAFFFEKIDVIKCLVNIRDDLKRFDDIDYYLSYLIKKFNVNDIINRKFYVKPIVMFKNDDPSMKSIINVVVVEYKNYTPMFFILEKSNERYKMRNIERRELEEILKQYSNIAIEHIYRPVIDNAIRRCK